MKIIKRIFLFFLLTSMLLCKLYSVEPQKNIVTPTLDSKIEKGKNLIFCGSFQLAWNELNKQITSGNIQLQSNPPIVKKLNRGHFSQKDISNQNFIAYSGRATKEHFNLLFEKLAHFIPSEDFPDIPINSNSFFAYSYLTKQFLFEDEFETDLNIKFINNNISNIVEGFGISNSSHSKRLLANQIEILDYINDDEFIIKLISNKNDDELILAKTESQYSLLETIKDVQKRIRNNKPSNIKSDEILKIPVIHLDINHQFNEIINQNFTNKSFEACYLTKALQTIDFNLDSKGATLESSAELEMVTFCGYSVAEKPREFIFDKPFLLYLKEKDADLPYFAIWFENTELFSQLSSNCLDIPYLNNNSEIGFTDAIFNNLGESKIQNHSPFLFNKKWGIKDKNDIIFIQPEFDSLFCFQEDLALVKKENKWGFINTKGEIEIDYQFEEGSSFSSSLAAVKFDNNCWGYINKKGEIVIEPKYAFAFPFYHNVARVLFDDWLFIDKNGNKLFTIDEDSYFEDVETIGNKALLHIQTGSNFYSFFNFVPLGYYLLFDSEDAKNILHKFEFIIEYKDKVLVRNENKSGVLDSSWNILIPLEYEGLIGSDNDFIAAKKDNKWGIIDKNNNKIINFKYLDAKIIKGIIALKKKDKWHIFNPSPKRKTFYKVDEFISFYLKSDEFILYEIKGESILDKSKNSEEIIISEVIENIVAVSGINPVISNQEQILRNEFYGKVKKTPNFSENYLLYKIDNMFGLINKESEVITKPIYNEISPISYGLAKITQNNKIGLINSNGEIIIEPKYDMMNDYEWFGGNKYCKFSQENQFGLIDYKGNVFLKPIFESIEDFGQYIKLSKGNLFGLINNEGDFLLEIRYNSIECFDWFNDKQCIKISNHNLFGIIDFEGNYILPIKYQEIKEQRYGRIMVKEKGIEKPIGLDDILFDLKKD